MTTMVATKPLLVAVLCKSTRKDGTPCRQMLFRAEAVDFNLVFEVKCPRCHSIQVFGPV